MFSRCFTFGNHPGIWEQDAADVGERKLLAVDRHYLLQYWSADGDCTANLVIAQQARKPARAAGPWS